MGLMQRVLQDNRLSIDESVGNPSLLLRAMESSDVSHAISELLQQTQRNELQPEQIVQAVSNKINSLPSNIFSANYILEILSNCFDWKTGAVLLEDLFSNSFSPAAIQKIDPTTARKLYLNESFMKSPTATELLQGRTIRMYPDDHDVFFSYLSTSLRDETDCLLIFPLLNTLKTEKKSAQHSSTLFGILMFALSSQTEKDPYFETKILICNLLLPILSEKLLRSKPLDTSGYNKPVLQLTSDFTVSSNINIQFSLRMLLDVAESLIPCSSRDMLFQQFSFIISEALIHFSLCKIDPDSEKLQIILQENSILADSVLISLRTKLLELLPTDFEQSITEIFTPEHER